MKKNKYYTINAGKYAFIELQKLKYEIKSDTDISISIKELLDAILNIFNELSFITTKS